MTCSQCSKTVIAFKNLYSIAQKNHCALAVKRDPDCRIKDEGITGSLHDSVYINDLPQFEMSITSPCDSLKSKLKDVSELPECYSCNDDALFLSTIEKEPPLKKIRSRRVTQESRTKIRTRKYFTSENVDKYMEHDQIVTYRPTNAQALPKVPSRKSSKHLLLRSKAHEQAQRCRTYNSPSCDKIPKVLGMRAAFQNNEGSLPAHVH